MANLVKIGNSQGVRIPKALIQQASLEGKELSFEIVGDGLLISPSKHARSGWKEKIEALLALKGNEPLDQDWLEVPLDTDEELEW
ncbi:MAG: AbrB family transcriptional regulator [SAR86 cluster bacterium]|uniref:AbrB family transcriptional regulator n=1 Tax=SAR86 cluster bacterium TaxID=2030880 RepID=A0A2A5CA61_9GAMM|nr:AbrB/MazE/SpoVT family DNA-binding domain-containing protein [bacterium AH-315-I11]MBN4075576.1 AbrB/MazE/SpoVT family DNA-binding domain-containing protein [Gammaproteobacteria bacterium AH-315-E17]PCJ40465.1 MAG: AbrB family transcriptional regulator [SAR86 cluster bacterium]